MRIRKDGIYFRRLWWWYPWHLSRWWLPRVWLGGDEWCNVPLCLTVPPFGCFLVFQFWRPMRTMPDAACWALLGDAGRADYLPGGCLEGGVFHEDRVAEPE